ncbi:MAG: PAS domain-containing protein [Thermodesulfobacteriota bacterium]|nr:PAS domain-containing protein [Thermodesulfobacteriota bacterium]
MGGIVKDSDVAKANNGDVHDLMFYRFVIDSLPTAVLTVNSDFKIRGFNPWAEKVTGYTEAEAISRYCGDILQGDVPSPLPLEDRRER